jgi:predicted DNA binding CopG/RHH family protein
MVAKKYLDSEEKTLIESLENDGWQPVKNLEEWKTALANAASNTLAKDQRMNIRMTKHDFDGIKVKAIEEGMPYQTLISSIIHKYLIGKLVEKQVS